MHLKITFFRIFSSGSRKEWAVLKLHSLFQKHYHMLERGSKTFGCFLDVQKAFNTGLMVFCTNYFISLISKAECGLL